MNKFINIMVVMFKLITFILFILVISCLIIFSLIFLFFYLIYDSKDYIYGDTHYYCGDNYEIYIASAGATDKYHYYIKEEKEILLFGNFKIVYTKEEVKTKEDYDYILGNYECSLVGEDDG